MRDLAYRGRVLALQHHQQGQGHRLGQDQYSFTLSQRSRRPVSPGDGVVGTRASFRRAAGSTPGPGAVIMLLTSPDMAALSDPPLTFVSSPGWELGRLGVEALLHQLEGELAPAPVLRAGTLESGESTGPAPGRRRSARTTRTGPAAGTNTARLGQ